MPSACIIKIPFKRKRKGLGAITKIQYSDGENQLYGDRNEKDEIGREVAAVVGELDKVGRKSSQNNSN